MATHRIHFAVRPAPGFSIVELMITLTVMAVLAAMAAPRFGGSIGRYRADMAARRIVQDLNLARSLAMNRSERQAVEFNPATHGYAILGMPDPDRAGRTHRVDLAQHPYEAHLVKLDLGADDAGSPTIAFDGHGSPDSGGTIVIGVGSLRRTISVTAGTGTVRIE